MPRTDPDLRATLRRWSVHMDQAGTRRLSAAETEQTVREQAHLLPADTDPLELVVAIQRQSAGSTSAVQSHGLGLDPWSRYPTKSGPAIWRYGLAGLTIREFGLHVPNGFSRNIFDPRANIAAACTLRRVEGEQAA